MFGLGGSELLVIALVALLVFGPGRIPEVARAIAGAYRELMRLRSQVDDTVGELRRDLDLNVDPLELMGPGTKPLLGPRPRAQSPADRRRVPRRTSATTADTGARRDVDDYLASAATDRDAADGSGTPAAEDPEPPIGGQPMDDTKGDEP